MCLLENPSATTPHPFLSTYIRLSLISMTVYGAADNVLNLNTFYWTQFPEAEFDT